MRHARIAVLLLAAAACSRSFDGPRPTVSAVVAESDKSQSPAVACNTQGDPVNGWLIDVMGNGFAPIPEGVLSGSPHLQMPTVTLVGPETYMLPPDRVSFASISQLVVALPTLNTAMPKQLQPGDYDVQVTNPGSGTSGRLAAALRITSQCKLLGQLSIDPRFGWEMQNQPVTISNDTTAGGDAFSGGAPIVTILAPLKSGSGTTAVQSVPVRRVSVVDAHTITGVIPTCTGASATDSSGTCAAGIVPGGPYDVLVTDPLGATGRIAGAFTVVSDPPPVITALTPTFVTTNGGSVVVTGAHFDSGNPATHANVLLGFQVSGGVEYCKLPVSAQSDTSITAQAGTVADATNCYVEEATGARSSASAGLTLAQGLYVVRVEHTSDVSFADYSGLIVTSTSYNPVVGPAIATRLGDPGLADFPLLAATDDVNRTFLYTLGGVTGTLGGLLTSDVGVAPVDPFGDVGGIPCTDAARAGDMCFSVLDRQGPDVTRQGQLGVGPSTTLEARSGVAAVVRQATESCGTSKCTTSYLIAIGGSDGTNSLATVQRAQVLRSSDAPVLDDTGTAQAGGQLAAGTYYYRVSAVLNGSDPANPGGETLASDLAPATPPASGKVTISWACVPNGTKYRVYRTASPNEPSGTEQLLDTVAANCSGSPAKQTYIDDGAKTVAAGADAPLPAGALGQWVTLASLSIARTQAKAILTGDDLWVVGGSCTAGSAGCSTPGALTTTEHIAFDRTAAGDPTASFVPSSIWMSAGDLQQARSRHALTVLSPTTAPNTVTSGNLYLLAVGGDANGTVINASGSIVYEVGAISGSSVTWAKPGSFSPTQSGNHGGWAEVQADNLFVEGTNSAGNLFFGTTTGGVCKAGGSCPISSAADLSFSLNNPGGISYSYASPRYLVGETLLRAYIYTAGGAAGTSSSASLTDTLERLIY